VTQLELRTGADSSLRIAAEVARLRHSALKRRRRPSADLADALLAKGFGDMPGHSRSFGRGWRLQRNAGLASARDEQLPIGSTREALARVHWTLLHFAVPAGHCAQRDGDTEYCLAHHGRGLINWCGCSPLRTASGVRCDRRHANVRALNSIRGADIRTVERRRKVIDAIARVAGIGIGDSHDLRTLLVTATTENRGGKDQGSDETGSHRSIVRERRMRRKVIEHQWISNPLRVRAKHPRARGSNTPAGKQWCGVRESLAFQRVPVGYG
jgi:hypothetical protein